MRKLIHIFLIASFLSINFSGLAMDTEKTRENLKNEAILSLLLTGEGDEDMAHQRFLSLVNDLKQKKHKYSSDRRYLQYVYRFIHKKVLKNYQKYVSLEQTLSKSGNYDCLTGTLLYSLILDELNYNYDVREFNYHVLLVINLTNEKLMIESTDPLNGFVIGESAIAERIEAYKEEDASKQRSSKYVFTEVMDNKITVKELTGLHYYNQAIYYLNQEEFMIASIKINRAYALYPSKRIKNISNLINEIGLSDYVATSR